MRSSSELEAAHFEFVRRQTWVAVPSALRVAWQAGTGRLGPGYCRSCVGGRSVPSSAPDCSVVPCASDRNTSLISPSAGRDIG